MSDPAAFQWIKTDCGRAKYSKLASRQGAMARLRLAWFVTIAAVRDWPLPPLPQSADESES
jgi:hypothetical protein